MRLFWRTGTLTAALAIAGAPLTVQALSLRDHTAQKNFQLVQFEQKGGERQGGSDSARGSNRAKNAPSAQVNPSDRGQSQPRVKSSEHRKSSAVNRADRTDRDGISRNRKPHVAGWQGGDRRRGVRYSWGPGFYFYDGYYHGDCSWLRRKASATGSHYWWQRYRQCRELD
jgi:hypothetical protein